MKYDLHVHSKYSLDGYVEPEVIVKTARKKGLSGLAVTDHNTIQGGLKAVKYETNDFKVIVGSEIETDRGEVIGLFLNEEIKSYSFQDVVQEIKDQCGLVIIPHPFDTIRGNGIRPTVDDIPSVDCIEVYNSRCLLEKFNHQAYEFAELNELKIVGGSDAHFAKEIGRAGVIVDDEITHREELLKANPTIFGEKTSIVNMGLTKMLKVLRKATSG